MKLYCLCQITGPGQYQMGKVLDNQVFLAQNRMVRPLKEENYFSVFLNQAMDLVRGGVRRLVPKGTVNEFPNKHPKTTGTRTKEQEYIRNNTKGDYRTVDHYHCPRCGAMMCVEK